MVKVRCPVRGLLEVSCYRARFPWLPCPQQSVREATSQWNFIHGVPVLCLACPVSCWIKGWGRVRSRFTGDRIQQSSGQLDV